VELVGWIGAEPEQRVLPRTAVCAFRVTISRLEGRNEASERTVATDWAPVEMWHILAETCTRFLNKGSRVRMVDSLHRHRLQRVV
jgi:single-strand DNA-binding protein